MKPLHLIWPFCLLMAACAPTQPEVRIEYVEVPVGVACIPRTLADPPVYSDSDDALAAARDAAERYLLLIIGREERKARAAEVEPAVAECRSQT